MIRIPMEDWLRGCVYHDGRKGEVTLSADKVLEIADYIQQTRKNFADGCIEIPPTIVGKHAGQMIIDEAVADTPQTDCVKPVECDDCKEHICYGCEHRAKKEEWRKANADCAWK